MSTLLEENLQFNHQMNGVWTYGLPVCLFHRMRSMSSKDRGAKLPIFKKSNIHGFVEVNGQILILIGRYKSFCKKACDWHVIARRDQRLNDDAPRSCLRNLFFVGSPTWLTRGRHALDKYTIGLKVRDYLAREQFYEAFAVARDIFTCTHGWRARWELHQRKQVNRQSIKFAETEISSWGPVLCEYIGVQMSAGRSL